VVIVEGVPRSIQSSSASLSTWKDQVASVARNVFSSPLRGKNISIRITVYYNGFPSFDTDNISKPIIDALKGVVYRDDKQVMDRVARRRDMEGAYRIKGVDIKLAEAIAKGDDFVCIEINKLSKREVERLI
jgi:Holliday junction resolvase RusA-like endonuclease